MQGVVKYGEMTLGPAKSAPRSAFARLAAMWSCPAAAVAACGTCSITACHPGAFRTGPTQRKSARNTIIGSAMEWAVVGAAYPSQTRDTARDAARADPCCDKRRLRLRGRLLATAPVSDYTTFIDCR